MTKRDQHTNDPALGHADRDDDRADAGADDADNHGDGADYGADFLKSRKCDHISFLFMNYRLSGSCMFRK